ncbi:iron reductase domain protein [Lophiostoma macrostomum CBS 122681]|uniref:Iron reductase domain protein n=1 Tax=Lophiostoma macrostomum CBS 122681 TaxID=1314788 RepID=A0A6A6THW4_9PLEO|nr:iron reductase domain protein [Lophiostoma macrostomum CBS 122681]
MHWTLGSMLASALLLFVTGIAGSVFQDPDTGFTFSNTDAAYQLGKTIALRVAIPGNVSFGSGYDAVIQVAAPLEIGYAGIAWGGNMIYNPLTVAWSSGTNSAVVSARWATGHTTPTKDTRTTLKLIPKGTKRNGTHWQFTALCSGCTSYLGRSNANYTLGTRGTNKIAFAYSATKPSSTSSDATIAIHETPIYPTWDFSVAGNPRWSELLTTNLGQT